MKYLVGPDGQPHYGVLEEPVEMVNYRDFDLRNTMNARRARWLRYWCANQFQFIGILSPELIAGVAIVDLKLVSNAFVYFYDVRQQRYSESSFLMPFGWKTYMESAPDRGECSFEQGTNRVEISATANPRTRRISVRLGTGESLFALIEEPAPFQPLRVCTRAGYTGWVYTQKAAGLPVMGSAHCHGRSWDLREVRALASYDWSLGFMRRETFWNWGCMGGWVDRRHTVGMNLAAGVNETSFTENGFWYDNEFTKVDLVDFRFDRDIPTARWTMRSNDGRVHLEFLPHGSRGERLHAGLMVSNFNQMFGFYTGELLTASGRKVSVENIPGFAEDHYAKW